jgi:type I restriction enzyme, R subunit
MVDNLTQSGWMQVGQLYESPFTDYSPRGIDGMFNPEQVAQLVGVLSEIRTRATV